VAAAHRSLIAVLVEQWRRPEGPLALLLVGYPVWWLLGVVQPVVLVACAAMLVRLVRDRVVALPRGFGWWLLWLTWVAAGVLVLQVDVPGAVPGGSSTRCLTWAIRLLWFAEVTIVLLYVLRARVSPRRVLRLLGWMFVTVVVGGVAGTVLPTLRLTSPLELLLPASLTHQAFLMSLIHPTLAEKHVYLEVVQYRPSGPFPYSNAWGVNYACFLPFFLAGWLARDAGWRRPVGAFVLVLSVVPVVYSGNRGLWLVLAVLLALVLVKHAAAGHLRPLLWATVGLVAGAALVVSTPLYAAVENRFTGHTSNVGRANLSTMTIDAVAQASPIMGVGTTRPVQGSFYSIAGGATPTCPLCTPPALGTQGFLWLMLFGTGFVGCALALIFWAGRVVRHRRARSPAGLASLSVLLAFVLTLPIYDWTITSGVAAMTAVALLEREAGRPRTVRLDARRRPMAYVAPAVAGCVVVGGVAGGLVAQQRGPTYVARAAMYLPVEPHAGGAARLQSLDTEARWVRSPAVLASTTAVRAVDEARHRGGISVDATANTRILGISYSSTDPERARSVAAALADSFLAQRADRLGAERALVDAAATREVDAGVQAAVLLERTGSLLHDPSAALPRAALAEAEDQLRVQTAAADRARRALTPVEDLRGHPVGTVTVRSNRHWNVAIGSGGLLGLLVAAPAVTWARRRARAEEGRRG
jgi:hypothetical protein